MVNKTEVEAQLRRILTSPTFVASPRAKQFLRYCVRHSTGSESGGLKETTIAIEVFNRPPDYNPKSDPIVRVHARRVREKLDTYYRTDGNEDPIRIDIPKGGYVPRISRTLPNRKTDFSDWDSEDGAQSNIEVGEAPAAPKQTPSGSRIALWMLLPLLLLILVLAQWIHARHTVSLSDSFGLLQHLNLPDRASDPAWSPDGTRLAFALTDAANGAAHVYLSGPGTGDPPVRLTHTDSAEMRPVWSPDGHRIALLKSLALSRFEIDVVRLEDGAVQSFGPFTATPYVMQEHPALDWSPDGSSLLTTEQMSPSSPMRLVLISVATGERTTLTSPPTGSTGDLDGKFSPDGSQVAFRRGGLGDLYVVSAKGEHETPATRLTFDMHGVRGIAWSDAHTILFGSNRGATNRFGIWKTTATGRTPEEVTPPDFDAVSPALSRNGTIVFTHRNLVTELTVHSVSGVVADRALFPSNAIDMDPALSPDGKLIAFGSSRGGYEQLWIGKVGDAAPAQVTHFPSQGLILYPAWSPDSRLVAFSYREGAATNIFLYSVATGLLKQMTGTHDRDITPVFGADGKYLYYSSNDDGTSRIWRARADGSEHPEPMFWEAVTGYVPSSDGKWMYFLEAAGQSVSLIRRNLKDATSESLFTTNGSPAFANAVGTAHGLVYIAISTNDHSQADVFQIAPETKAVKLATHLTGLPPYEVSGFAVSPDGQSMIVSKTIRNASSLYVETFNSHSF